MAEQRKVWKSNVKKFPSNLKEPKAVIVWSSENSLLQNDNYIHELKQVEETLKGKDIRTESLDVNKTRSHKYLKMFTGQKNVYPQVWIYESNDADFVCYQSKHLQSMIDDDEFDEEFEECVGANEFEEDVIDEKEYFSQSKTIYESKEFEKKKISRYSSEELAAYVMKKSLNDLTRNMIKYKVSGKDLKKVQNPKDLMRLLHVEKEVAQDFFEIIQEEKEKQVAKRLNQKFPETSDNWLNKPMLKWSTRETKGWISSFINNKKEREMIFKTFDIHNFNGRNVLRYDKLDALCEELEIDPDSKKDVKILEKIIQAAGIQMDKEFDSDEKKEEKTHDKAKEFRVRDFRQKKYGIRSSKYEDCIMKYTNEDGIARAAMQCGHAIASSTMFYYIKQTFATNYSASEITCPVPNCKKVWDWGICTMVADMDDDELTYYNKMRTKRIFTNLCECQNCGKMIDRPENLTVMRVVCTCRSTNFCFKCGLIWKKGDSEIVCGNKECVIVIALNETLKKESWGEEHGVTQKFVSGHKDRKLPKIRACPRCLTLVIHKTGCKWMKCQCCKKDFCFCCLALATDSGELQCKNMDNKSASSHWGICPVAPIQQFG
eukprot:292184_1